MQEIDRIWLKYEEGSILDRLESLDEVNRLALIFGSDAAQTFRLLTLMRMSKCSGAVEKRIRERAETQVRRVERLQPTDPPIPPSHVLPQPTTAG